VDSVGRHRFIIYKPSLCFAKVDIYNFLKVFFLCDRPLFGWCQWELE
jgi:hypothetical protein